MEYEDFIRYFTNEIGYRLKMMGVPWRVRYEGIDDGENVMTVISGKGRGDFPPISSYDYYQLFLQGMPWGVAAQKATQDFFDDSGVAECALRDMEIFNSDMVIPTFMNKEENAERLERIPHLKFEDLEIVLQVVYESLGGSYISLVVTDPILQEWDLGLEELYQKTLNNPRNMESVQIIELYKMMAEVLPDERADLPPIYVVTNNSQHLGAASILYKEKMHELAEFMGDDILLVPMSVDNFFAFPLLKRKDINYIADALRDSNEMIVGKVKALSGNLYHYNCKTNQFCMLPVNLQKEMKKRGR